MRVKVAVYDADKGYRERFADYLMSYKATEIELAVFTNEQFFFEALNVDKFHLFVLGSGYEAVLSHTRSLKVPILILTESAQSYVKETIEMADECVVYTSKYQSMDKIIRKMQMMAEAEERKGKTSVVQRTFEVVGVFSPVRHEMQMLFSMLFAGNAGKERRVLYVNLLEFSGFSEMFGETEYDLSDAVLQVRESEIRMERFLACIYESEGVSYISPMANPENLREISGQDVQFLLEAIARYTDYQMVVLDMGLNVRDFAKVLTKCDRIYCLCKRGYLFEIQERQFFEYLEKAVDTAFPERVRRVEIPGQTKISCGGMNLLEQLNWGEFGDLVRNAVFMSSER